MRTIIKKKWQEQYTGRFAYGESGTAAMDECAAEVVAFEAAHNGRTYLRETVWKNGVIVLASEYPAGTEYARKRIGRYS